MRHLLLLPVALAAGLLDGCNGEIRSRVWDRGELQKEASEQDGIRGVFGYYTKAVIEVDELTQLVDKEGKIVLEECNHNNTQKVVTVTDYDHPVQIWYDYGLLEANTFGVALSNSVFASVNSESTPDQGKTLANLAEAATKAAGITTAAKPPKGRKKDCNAGATFAGYAPLPPLP